ncbi:xyloglucan fucosyltransferase [Marchantia polymorpha subsp. ruderalis]|nr:hypothetical protein MARPO_0029s0110 [Marchantia polymorpha]BBM96876.1 hypothetical protein Mp_1g01370 [Marchantia polymorpha subsp. ruderalis]|eukprot:PTQ42607.1 hypothetical protein MARPO_0029s0110 [Marchantia polymorpha]
MAASKGGLGGGGAGGGKAASKPTVHIWVVIACLGLLAWFLLALGFFADVVRRSPYSSAITQHLQTKTWRRANPAEIDCGVVGVEGKFIPKDQQYHPLTEKGNRVGKSCRSRYEQHCLWKSSNFRPTAEFLGVLRSYEEHHSRCVEGHDLQTALDQGSAPKDCQYLIWNDLDGKGNQLVSLVSAFVYALLTRRVLLITREAQLQHLLCEPFPSSSWVVPEEVPHVRHRAKEARHGTFYARALNETAQGRPVTAPKHLVCFLSNLQKPDDLRFFCPGEQKLLEKVPWLFFWSNQYSVPGLYFVPGFRAKLNAWFPDRAVFLHAGRYLLSPRDEIWLRVMRIYTAHMAPADRRVGIQIRAWSNEYKPIITRHILSCAWFSGLLPNVSSARGANSTSSSLEDDDMATPVEDDVANRDAEDFSAARAGERVSVVLTSLRREYAEGVAEAFAEGRTEARQTVTVLSPSAEGEQRTGRMSHERKAIADMWLLSFADDLISTPRSTFGYVAHGLAGIRPIVFNRYGLDPDTVPDPPCLRTNVPGPCFIDHPHQMSCPLDGPAFDIGDSATALPEVRHCLLQWGVGVFEGVD